jgi:hypothetical protein
MAELVPQAPLAQRQIRGLQDKLVLPVQQAILDLRVWERLAQQVFVVNPVLLDQKGVREIQAQQARLDAEDHRVSWDSLVILVPWEIKVFKE